MVEVSARLRSVEIGCGTGGNAVWLAKQGWKVTAVDYSVVAIERGMRMAAEAGVDIEFIEADASKFQPRGHYDLITCFYIQLFPQQRADMLANMSKALAQGGTLLFVSHDKSRPPPGWSREDMQSLTTAEEIASELSGLQIEQAFVLDHAESCHASSHGDDEKHEHNEHQDSWGPRCSHRARHRHRDRARTESARCSRDREQQIAEVSGQHEEQRNHGRERRR